jgi:hypothetical protein
MIELTPEDVSVILRHASTQGFDLPVAQLNDDGQTEIVRWIEYVGKLDDQLSPYAWYSLAEEAASSFDPDEPIMIEMLPTYTLSGESEMLELNRMSHFDWSIEAVPVEFIENAEDLIDAGVPVRFLLLAEAAGVTFSKRVSELCPDMEEYEPQLMACAINAFFLQLCESAGIVLENPHLSFADDDMHFESVDEAQFDVAVEEGIASARSVMLLLDPELGASFPATQDLIDLQWFKISS